MDITFNRNSKGEYVSTFTVNDNFNIHLEFADETQTLTFGQRTSGEEFDDFFKLKDHVGTYDKDSNLGFVFPKDFRIVSTSRVIRGIIKEV